MGQDGSDEEKGFSSTGKVRLSMWLTKRQHSELKELAMYDGRTVSDIIRQLVGMHLRDEQTRKVEEHG